MWNFIRPRNLLFLAAASLSAAAAGSSPANATDCALPVFEEGAKFVVEAWAVPDPYFDVGEPLRVQMRVSTPSFLTLFHVSTSCKVTRLIKNRAMAPAEIADFPAPGSGLKVVVKPPGGVEAFYLVTTREPLEFLSGSDILSGTGDIASLDLNPYQYYRRLSDALGRINPYDWSVFTLHTTVRQH